ncbi:helix-turn-helix transcriptional regulator [Leucobacter sp. HY1910]
MSARERVPSEQRLFSLVLALVVSPSGVTKRDLLRSVHGYADRYEFGGLNASLERQFERDKEQLRALGIHVETRDSPLEPGNNQLTRYRISKHRLQFPAGLQFDAHELTLLRLAAIAWSEGSMSEGSRHAVVKLEALGAGLDVRHLGVAPKLGPIEPGAGDLQRAIDAGRTVSFDYTNPGRDAPHPRRVAPLALHRAHGRWHLLGWDIERDAARVFLLARISGPVRRERSAIGAHLREMSTQITARMITELGELAAKQQAQLRVRADSVAEARLRALQGARDSTCDGTCDDGALEPGEPGEPVEPARDRMIEVPYLDAHLLAAQLVEYGPDVAVVSPPELRTLVVDALRAITAAHAGTPGATPQRDASHQKGAAE